MFILINPCAKMNCELVIARAKTGEAGCGDTVDRAGTDRSNVGEKGNDSGAAKKGLGKERETRCEARDGGSVLS